MSSTSSSTPTKASVRASAAEAMKRGNSYFPKPKLEKQGTVLSKANEERTLIIRTRKHEEKLMEKFKYFKKEFVDVSINNPTFAPFAPFAPPCRLPVIKISC